MLVTKSIYSVLYIFSLSVASIGLGPVTLEPKRLLSALEREAHNEEQCFIAWAIRKTECVELLHGERHRRPSSIKVFIQYGDGTSSIEVLHFRNLHRNRNLAFPPAFRNSCPSPGPPTGQGI